jgi:hypothetical protein
MLEKAVAYVKRGSLYLADGTKVREKSVPFLKLPPHYQVLDPDLAEELEREGIERLLTSDGKYVVRFFDEFRVYDVREVEVIETPYLYERMKELLLWVLK